MRKLIKQERIEEIYEAALDTIDNKGLDKTTLDEIAEKVNITKPALYFYFKSKDELFFSLIRNRFDILKKRIDLILESNETSIVKLKRVVDTFVDFGVNNKKFFLVLLNSQQGKLMNFRNKDYKKRIFKNCNNELEKIKSLIQECINDGYLKNKDPYFLSFALRGFINQTVMHYIMSENNLFPKKIKPDSEEILSLFLDGAGTKKSTGGIK